MNPSNSNIQMIRIDIINFERKQRQFMNELAMKRTQVEDLKKELDAANLKIHQLTRNLNTFESTSKDNEFNLNLALKNSRFLDDQLQAKREAVMKSRMQYDSLVAEKENLRELLQKSEMEKYDLQREVNELKTQHRYDVAYQQELMDHDAKTRGKIAQLTEMMQKLQISQDEVIELSEKVKNCEELQKTVEFYRDKYYKCKKEFVNLEEKVVVASAALGKFERLTASHQLTQQDETEIIIKQWEKATKWFNEETQSQKKLIENLSIALKSAQEANTKLCMQEADLEKIYEHSLKENEELKNKIQHITSKTHIDSEIQTEYNIEAVVKPEIVTIDCN